MQQKCGNASSPFYILRETQSIYLQNYSNDTESSRFLLITSVSSQDGGDDLESDSSEDSCTLSKFDSADFLSSHRSLQMSESKRKRLRELEASEHFVLTVSRLD